MNSKNKEETRRKMKESMKAEKEGPAKASDTPQWGKTIRYVALHVGIAVPALWLIIHSFA